MGGLSKPKPPAGPGGAAGNDLDVKLLLQGIASYYNSVSDLTHSFIPDQYIYIMKYIIAYCI